MDELRQVAPGLWLASDPVRIVGMRLAANMVVVELGPRKLLLFSPVAYTPARAQAVDALGEVAHIVAPNTFHHLSAGDWCTAYPSAVLHASRGLAPKRRDLHIDRFFDEPAPPDFAGFLEEIPIEGFALEEAVFVHRASGTLLVADLVHNIGRPEHGWTRLYSTMMGFFDQVALSRVIRWTAFHDRQAARRSLDQVLAHDFDRLVVGHGEPLETGGREAIERAYEWLDGRRAFLPAARGPSTSGACG